MTNAVTAQPARVPLGSVTVSFAELQQKGFLSLDVFIRREWYRFLDIVAANNGTVTNTTGDLTENAVVVGNGTVDVKTLASLGAVGQVLTSQGPGQPPVFSAAAAGSGTVTHTVGPLTNHALVIGSGVTVDDEKTIAAMTDGQLVVGATGADPAPKTISGAITLSAAGVAAFAGIVPIANGGTNTATPALVAGTNITSITGTWPNNTINASFGTFFTETLVTAAPNATINEVVLSLVGGTASDDMVLSPKGTSGGFHLGPTADSTATGGNKRGVQAVDLNLNRTSAANAATGQRAFQAGGIDLKASGLNSASVGGSTNSATQNNSANLGGTACASSAAQAVTLGGSSLVSSGADSCSSGNGSQATAGQTFAANSGTLANAVGASAFGVSSTTRAIVGSFARASGPTAAGKQQAIDLVLRGTTTDAATAVVLTANGGGAAATNQFLLPTGTGLKVRAQLIGKNAATGDCVWFDLSGACKNVATVVTLSGTSVSTAANGDAALLTCTCAVVADNTNKCLSITVNGVAATTIAWVCEVTSAENNT